MPKLEAARMVRLDTLKGNRAFQNVTAFATHRGCHRLISGARETRLNCCRGQVTQGERDSRENRMRPTLRFARYVGKRGLSVKRTALRYLGRNG